MHRIAQSECEHHDDSHTEKSQRYQENRLHIGQRIFEVLQEQQVQE